MFKKNINFTLNDKMIYLLDVIDSGNLIRTQSTLAVRPRSNSIHGKLVVEISSSETAIELEGEAEIICFKCCCLAFDYIF